MSRSTGEDSTISKDQTFNDCVVLSKDAFDPDAVFLEDIVDDDVLPYLSLAVDGLTSTQSLTQSDLELSPDTTGNDDPAAPFELPDTPLDPEQLEIYGWESTLWRRLKRFVGL